ncbi:MAG: hypothetical protein A2937_01180 [Candidatus Yonathbacteria bacterium RIFCSPLOWO2_01_FULL_47_33b]|uniref:Prepilin-type N-terminal cleavage/methylation domain-containing protein n=1 Tax=Candidatus Yonathbacteria bacterium RIFCSPLOWO2_01_FULL_47_33b TaxID=1802727 RepID=A0A1G2SHA1_9BACT|nr:MAG: hypothetical protein A2937_01180 [Candidatus Yonathbacteria bacterium RIFCSPLOWO2_01_FULL_47_33b]
MNIFHKKQCKTRGFTLAEMVVYTAFLAVLAVLAINALLAVSTAFSYLRVSRNMNTSAEATLERISREIRNAYDVDLLQTTQGTSPGRLTLKTKDSLGANTTIEFYVDANNRIAVREGGVDAGTLMAKNTTVNNFVVNVITTNNSLGLKVDLGITGSRGTIAESKNFYDTLILRRTY